MWDLKTNIFTRVSWYCCFEGRRIINKSLQYSSTIWFPICYIYIYSIHIMLTDMYIPNYKYMFVYIYIWYIGTRSFPFSGPGILLHDLPGAPFWSHPKLLAVRSALRWWVCQVGWTWCRKVGVCGGHWPKKWWLFWRAGSTQKMEVYSWEIIERSWIFHCSLVEMMTDFACLSLSEHVRKDLLSGNFAWGKIYDDQCS